VLNNPQHTFYFIFDRAYDKDYLIADNIVPLVVGPQARHPWLWYWWFEQSLPRLFKKYQIDLFYSPEIYCSLKANVPTLLVSHDIVFETHKDPLPSYQQRYLEKTSPRFHAKADHIIAVSNFTKNELIEKYKIKAEKISVGGNACPDGFKPINVIEKKTMQSKYAESSPYILYVGAIHPRKNVVNMVKAFSAYKAAHPSDLKFLVIGRMAWKSDEINEAINKTQDVIYYSRIEEELKPMMAGAEALMFASLYEGFGIPILEAMKSEIPVITSNGTSMKEVAADAALLVDPLSISEIKNAITQVVGNESLSKQLVEKGKQRLKKYNWDDIASTVEKQLFALTNSGAV